MRPKEFSRNRVLEKCILLFWNNGFKSSSFGTIYNRTGVNRASLFNEFENKNGILLASLDLYFERYIRPKLKVLEESKTFEYDIFIFFKSFFIGTINDGFPLGCYTIAISTEVGKAMNEVNEKLMFLLDEIKKSIHVNFKNTYPEKHISALTLNQLLGLFCSSIGICLVLSKAETNYYLKSNLNLIFHAEAIKNI
ncbi:MAG: TetR/AcrR family transcriptional regulator [Chitinophagales bacterium]|nr:TetR/AcrR family transcriptional regulator [Chitinophagales bacterium]